MRVVIHGHFYQPPRENPWTGVIPRQESAHPAHDWNEKITIECYRRNGTSRVISRRNLTADIVNNYAYINFNFGPTLLSWIEAHAPDVYRRILEADRTSRALQDGHGNGIAQVYNHVIMPLASFRDKHTQVVWGLTDFEWRFGRKSESIWLGETAVNLETARVLIDHGIRYVILSPFQALRVRPLDRSGPWTDARGGRIDPRRSYRFFLKDSRRHRVEGRSIDVFFYDGGLANDVSFNHLLRSAPELADRIVRAGEGLPPGQGLVNLATDGEVYGHHELYADMCLSYLIREEGPRRGLEFTNYGRYLDHHPPEWEVDLDFGEHDEGTAWSCAHGVGRWERDCGCGAGDPPEWNQKWRTPLRRGFDAVRDRLVEVYLEQVSPLLADAWIARDDYVTVLLDPTEERRAAFLDRHARRPLGGEERQKVWRLLESQRHAMLMYTSCGWFFSDICRMEPVQNMAYAARAIELASPWAAPDLEERLLEHLGEAWSNRPEMGTGADIYRRFVRPQCVDARAVAGDLALGAAVLGEEPPESLLRFTVLCRRFERTQEAGPGTPSHRLTLDLVDRATEESHRFEVYCYHRSLADIRCYVLESDGAGAGVSAVPTEPELSARPGVSRFDLRDMVAEDREHILRRAFESMLERQEDSLGELYRESRDLMVTFHGAGVPVSPVLRALAQHVVDGLVTDLAGDLEEAYDEMLERTPPPPPEAFRTPAPLAEIDRHVEFSRVADLEIDLGPLGQVFGRVVRRMLDDLLRSPDAGSAERAAAVLTRARSYDFVLDWRPLEDLAFAVLRKHRSALLDDRRRSSAGDDPGWRAFETVAGALQLDILEILQRDVEETATVPGDAP
jgi:alpha-amylase/alpha-mannosidase (GH57 family)